MKLLVLFLLIFTGSKKEIQKGDEIVFIQGTAEEGYYKYAVVEENDKPLNPLFNGLKVIVKKIKKTNTSDGKETLLYVTMSGGEDQYIIHFEKALEAKEIRLK